MCGMLLSCSKKQKQTTDKQRPNIIWLMAEDISLDLECYGMKAVKTPVLNKLAEKGVRFDNCFVTNPICSPSRSAMMTGVHQVKINAHNHRSNRNVPLNNQFKPFTYWLREAGYTCILGHQGVMKKGRKIDVNFKHKPLGEWNGVDQFGLFDKFDTFEKEDQPFFAQIQLVVTHRGDWWNEVRENSTHRVNPEEVELPEYIADHPVTRLDWAKYLDQMEYMDNEVGMIIKELEEKGMADNTIIVFIGDNGRCNIRGKGYLHDPGLRIPLIVYNPLDKPETKIRKDVVAATDITATILEWAGAEIPPYLTGNPMFNENFERKYAYGARDLWDEVEEKMRSVTSEKWKYIRNDKPEQPWDAAQAYLEFYRPAVHVMRTLKEEGKLTENELLFFADSKPKEELYNLQNDPHELNNLASDSKYSSVLNELRTKTKEYDKLMEPVDTIYEPINPSSVELLEWVKTQKPELYQQMLEGVEIGFQTLGKEYKTWKKKNQ
jgi:arylsulfatase A-like enzyme